MRRACAAGLIVLALFAAACSDSPTEQGPPQPGGVPDPVKPVPVQQGDATSIQAKVAKLMADRAARRLPTPTVSYEFRSPQGSSLGQLQSKKYGPGEGYTYTAKTVMHYQGPADAGLQRWPELTLSPEHSQKLGLTSEELRHRYVSAMEKSQPGFWQRYELGFEPRTYTITESGTTTYPELMRGTAGMSALAPADATATAATEEDLVFGFSVDIPGIKESVSFGFHDVEELTFSFEADWNFGMRFPVLGLLNSPEPMDEGSTYSATSKVEGRDYSGAQYAGVGLPAESGNEVYFRYVVEGCVRFSGVIDTDKQCAGPDIRRARDFTTPFGAGDAVPFPSVDVAILDYGLAGIDLKVNSSVGSDQITADWSVQGAALGTGHLSYNSPTSLEALSPVKAIDGPGQASFSIDGFLYHFTEFDISPRLKLWVDVEVPIPFAPDLEWDDSWSISLGTYDLSDFIDRDFVDSHGASVGVHHPGTGYTGATNLRMGVEVANVAPTASIGLAGGQELTVQGIPTVLGNTGDVFSFTGTSHDPGRDGLTLSWDWGDGPPAPDQSASYPLAGATGPNDATDVRTHAFERACLYDVSLKSVDDDAAFGEDHVSILVTETGHAARMEGFWQHQLGRQGGGLLEPALVDCYLAMVGRVSAIFSEVRAVSSMDAAFAVVNVRQSSGSELEQLDREILVAWLNFASGAIGYSQLVDSNSDGIEDTPLYQVMQAAETVRLDPASAAKALKLQRQLIHKISEQFTRDFIG